MVDAKMLWAYQKAKDPMDPSPKFLLRRLERHERYRRKRERAVALAFLLGCTATLWLITAAALALVLFGAFN